MPANSNIYLEIFGYIGTALVISSMLMTSVVKLRILNICGAVISLIYAAFIGALPVVLLNGALSAINIVQLIRIKMKKSSFNNSDACTQQSAADVQEG